jgi:RNA-directed DNA polymerase
MIELKCNLLQAYFEARKNKRNAHSQLVFEVNFEKKIWKLYDDIVNGNYKIGKSIAFIIDKPVKREIFAADFRDRVVHHLLFRYINPILEPQFIGQSYSCRKGKGTFLAIKEAYENLEISTNHFTNGVYVLKLDIKGYFMNINKDKLLKKLSKMISEKDFVKSRMLHTQGNAHRDLSYQTLFSLIRTVVYNDPTINCTLKSYFKEWDNLPGSKSLFSTKANCGLPIGNLTSQLFSNVYLNDFDHYLKNDLQIKYYGRYVDDFYIFHQSKDYLKYILSECKKYLYEEGLEIHPKKIYLQHYSKGFQFLGVYIKPGRIYIGKRSASKFKSIISEYSRDIEDKEHTAKELQPMRSIINSYLGLMSHYNTYKLRFQIIYKKNPNAFYKVGYFQSDLKKIIIYPHLLI